MTQQMVKTDDGYRQAQQTIRDCVCSTCRGELVVKWDFEVNVYGVFCPRDCAGKGVTPRRDIEQADIRQRLERSPQIGSAIVPVTNTPLTTNALKSLSDDQLKSRVEVAFADVQGATPALRGQIMALSKLYGLDPVFDLMIYQSKPYVTYDGRMRKLREAPLFTGEKELRPLSKAEKEEWGFNPADIVVKNTVDMGPHGLVTDFGVVRAQGETSPVAKSHPQLLAIKRARARVSRVATGIDLPTVIEARGRVVEVQELRDTPRALQPGDIEARARGRFWATARSAPPDGLGLTDADVHRLLGVQTLTGYPGGWDKALVDLTERAAAEDDAGQPDTKIEGMDGPAENTTTEGGQPSESRSPEAHRGQDKLIAGPSQEDMSSMSAANTPTPEADSPAMIKSARDPRMNRLAELIEEAAGMDIEVESYKVQLPAPQVTVELKLQKLSAEIQSVRRQLAGDPDDVEQAAF